MTCTFINILLSATSSEARHAIFSRDSGKWWELETTYLYR